MELSFAGPDGEGHDWISISVNPAMTETVRCLKRLGLVTGEDLVTYRALYPWDYDTEENTALRENLSPDGSATVYAEEAASVMVSPA